MWRWWCMVVQMVVDVVAEVKARGGDFFVAN